MGMYTWEIWIPKGEFHLHGLETYPYSSSGFLEGGLE